MKAEAKERAGGLLGMYGGLQQINEPQPVFTGFDDFVPLSPAPALSSTQASPPTRVLGGWSSVASNDAVFEHEWAALPPVQPQSQSAPASNRAASSAGGWGAHASSPSLVPAVSPPMAAMPEGAWGRTRSHLSLSAAASPSPSVAPVASPTPIELPLNPMNAKKGGKVLLSTSSQRSYR